LQNIKQVLGNCNPEKTFADFITNVTNTTLKINTMDDIFEKYDNYTSIISEQFEEVYQNFDNNLLKIPETSVYQKTIDMCEEKLTKIREFNDIIKNKFKYVDKNLVDKLCSSKNGNLINSIQKVIEESQCLAERYLLFNDHMHKKILECNQVYSFCVDAEKSYEPEDRKYIESFFEELKELYSGEILRYQYEDDINKSATDYSLEEIDNQLSSIKLSIYDLIDAQREDTAKWMEVTLSGIQLVSDKFTDAINLNVPVELVIKEFKNELLKAIYTQPPINQLIKISYNPQPDKRNVKETIFLDVIGVPMKDYNRGQFEAIIDKHVVGMKNIMRTKLENYHFDNPNSSSYTSQMIESAKRLNVSLGALFVISPIIPILNEMMGTNICYSKMMLETVDLTPVKSQGQSKNNKNNKNNKITRNTEPFYISSQKYIKHLLSKLLSHVNYNETIISHSLNILSSNKTMIYVDQETYIKKMVKTCINDDIEGLFSIITPILGNTADTRILIDKCYSNYLDKTYSICK